MQAAQVRLQTVLDGCRLEMERSSALIRQAQALVTELQEVRRARWLRGAVPAERPAVVTRDEVHCSMSGCTRPARFRPCFVVERGIRRILIGDMPVRVCSEHRVDLDALLRRPALLDELRRDLRVRGHGEPDAVHVVFDVVG